MTDVLTQTGVVQGCEVTAQAVPDFTVAVAGGFVVYQNAVAAVSAGNATITAADATYDRQDAVVASTAGVVSVLTGTLPAAGDNALPPSTTGYVPLSYVYVFSQANTNYTGTIVTSVVLDTPRVLVSLPEPANTMAYTFSTVDGVDSDPGSGNFKLNAGTLGTNTAIYVSYLNPTVPAENERWLTQGVPYYLKFWSRSNPGNWVVYKVTAVVTHTNYDSLTVVLDSAGGPRGTAGAVGGWANGTIFSTLAADMILERTFGPAVVTNTNGSATLGADVTLTPVNTMVDAVNTGSLPSGTYLLNATIAFLSTANAHVFTARLWDGTTTYVESETPSAANVAVTISLDALVVLAATTTLKVSAASDTGTADKIKAAVTKNSAGNFATVLTWVRLA